MSRDSELDQNLSGDLRTNFSSDLNDIWYVGRGRWVMHDGMPYGRNQGQGQGHSREVDRQSPTGLSFSFSNCSSCILFIVKSSMQCYWSNGLHLLDRSLSPGNLPLCGCLAWQMWYLCARRCDHEYEVIKTIRSLRSPIEPIEPGLHAQELDYSWLFAQKQCLNNDVLYLVRYLSFFKYFIDWPSTTFSK